MKKVSLWLRALCFGIILCMCAATFPLTALAADSDAPNGTELVNQFNRRAPAKKIAVNPGDVVYFGPAICWGSYVHMKAWDSTESSATLVSDITPSTAGVAKVDTFGYYDIYSYTVPAGVAAVSVNDTRLYPNVYMVTINQKLTKKNFNEYWENERPALLNNHGQYLEPKTNLSLYQRSALFLGDSITHASRDDGTRYHSWAGRIGDVNDMDWVNAAVDGASITTLKAVEKQFVTQMNDHLDREFDYVMIWGGINDAWINASIGTISTSNDPTTFNRTTFVGALEHLFYTVKTNYPDANYGYIITFPIVGLTEGNLANWGSYVEEAIKVCQKWEIPYLDLYHDTDFCNELKIGTSDKSYIADCVHPTGKGYDLLYPKIEAWMDSLDPLPPAPPVTPNEPTAPSEPSEPETTAAPVETTTVAPTEETGCGASLSTMTAAFLTLCLSGAALLLFRKKRITAE